jgi:polyphosphate kinase 2
MAKSASHSKGDKKKQKEKRAPLPKVIEPEADAPRIKTKRGSFDLDDLELPAWVEERAFKSGGYPYDEGMKDKDY